MLSTVREKVSAFQQYLAASKKRTFTFAITVLVLIALPLLVIVSQQQQTIRQRASELVSSPFPPSSSISLRLSPSSATIPIGQQYSFDLYLNAGTNVLTGIDLTFNYNKNILSLQKATMNKVFNSVLLDSIGDGIYRYAAADTSSTSITGDIKLGTLTFLANAFGQTTLTFQNAQATVLGNDRSVQANTTNGTITISFPTPTLTVATATPIPSPTPFLSPIPTITRTPNKSLPGDANNDKSIDILDFNIWRQEFLNGGKTKLSDFNNDGVVDIADFAIWRNAFSKPSTTIAPTSVPISTPAPTIASSPTPNLLSAKRVFITNFTYPAKAQIGIASPDNICNAFAENAKVGGKWKAWLSYDNNDVSQRLNHYDGPYKLMTGQIVANNWQDLTDGKLQNSIRVTIDGKMLDTAVWTGTTIGGTITPDTCSSWTSTAGFGNTGWSGNNDSGWTQDRETGCNQKAAYYCFEQ